MPVRIKITLLFASLVAFILLIVVGTVYYFSYTLRIDIIKARLTNRVTTVGRLLSQTEVFSNSLIRRIDSSTAIGYTSETIQAYDDKNEEIYQSSDHPDDVIKITRELLEAARQQGSIFFRIDKRDAVAYRYTDKGIRLVMVAAGEDRDGKRNLQGLIHILLLSYLGGLVIAGVGGYIFSNTLLRPIKNIADVANRITAQNLTQRVKVSRPSDEWRYLADTLNDLLDRLQDSFDVQRRFISNASHELSTPLTSISSQIEVSLQRERSADEYRKVMISVYQDVLHLSQLTKTLLEFAKASGKPGGIEISEIRIDEVLFRLPAEITKMNNKYSVVFEFDDLPADENKLLVLGNEELLFTAFRNLVSNACKYASDGRALIKLGIKNREAVISITDKGTGIPPAEIEKIFQPFHRAEGTHHKEGFGLGLSLASRIIKLHKGRIEVSSIPGEGSTFTVHLPGAGWNIHL